MYLKLKDGKSKVLTLSYDDGVIHDIRLMEIMNKNGLKGTFNINTGLYADENAERVNIPGRMTLAEAQRVFKNSGHEVAVHGKSHPFLDRIKDFEIFDEILEDRKNIEKQFGTFARGLAYPYGRYNDEVVEALKKCGICYARTVKSTENFNLPENWLTLHPTCHHKNPRLLELAKRFAESPLRIKSENRMFYLWGHSFEFAREDNWSVIEEFAEYIGGRDDIWYATNIEIYDYVKAYENLIVSADKKMVYNPSMLDVWFCENDEIYCVHAGETLFL